MQGADGVNDGFDETFERRESRLERIGHVVLSLLVAAGPSGLLGHGRLSHRTTRSVASGLAVEVRCAVVGRDGKISIIPERSD